MFHSYPPNDVAVKHIFNQIYISIKKGSLYSIAERRVLEMISVLSSQPAGDVTHKPPGLQLPSQPSRGLLPISLLGEQRHKGCEQFA